MAESTVFGAFLAFGSEQVSATEYRFLIDPDNPAAVGPSPAGTWVTVNLEKIPVNVRTNGNPQGTCAWEDVEIDAGEKGSATRLVGWSRGGNFRGVVYLSRNKFPLALPPPGASPPPGALPPGPSQGGKDYEFMAIVYSPGVLPQSPNFARMNGRFYGFHARIQKTRADGQVLVSVYHAGTSQETSEEPHVTFWLDFSNPAFDFSYPGSIGTERPEGALFIHRDKVETLELKLRFPDVVLQVGKDRPTLGLAGHLALNAKVGPM